MDKATERNADLHLHDRDDSFTLKFKEKIVLVHSSDSPCVEVGKGSGRFKFIMGLFKIRGRIKERRPCRKYTVKVQSEKRIVWEFENGLTMTAEVVDGRLHFGFECSGDWNRFWICWAAESEEAVYGGGEQYSRLNLRGSVVPIWVQEPGLGRGFDLFTLIIEITKGYGGKWFSTYFSQPTFLFSSGSYVHSESSAYTLGIFNSPNRHRLEIWEIPRQIVFGVDTDPQFLLESLTGYLGRQPVLPDWTYDGMWLGIQGGREITHTKLRRAREAGVKVGALWCQDWEGVRMTSFGKQLMWNWRYDENLYPQLPAYAQQLKKDGIRYLGYINSFLAIEGDLYKEASPKGYCVKNTQGDDYLVTITTFPAAMLDLSNPECRRWIKNVIKDNMIGAGLSGWMADFGEYIPVDAVFHDGSDGLTYHNRYIAEWAKINREAVEEAGCAEDVTFFMRAGYTGSTAYSSGFWNGDQLVNWSRHQGLPTVIPGSLSMGMVGAAYVHSDIGGYTTLMWLKRSRELFMRWAEQAVFTQTMRSHEGNRPQIGLQLFEDEAALAHLAKMTRIYTTLKPYHRHLSRDYQEKGLPPMRHVWVHYPNESSAHRRKNQYQYLYGADLLIAPVVRKGSRSQRVQLPIDRWIHLWTGREFSGGEIHVPAPLGEPPVFYRRNSTWRELFEELKTC